MIALKNLKQDLWSGIDEDLFISLFSHGVVWKEIPSDPNCYEFIFSDGEFTETEISSEVLRRLIHSGDELYNIKFVNTCVTKIEMQKLIKESWFNFSNFAKCMGADKTPENYVNTYFPSCVFEAVQYHGLEKIFQTKPSEFFHIHPSIPEESFGQWLEKINITAECFLKYVWLNDNGLTIEQLKTVTNKNNWTENCVDWDKTDEGFDFWEDVSTCWKYSHDQNTVLGIELHVS